MTLGNTYYSKNIAFVTLHSVLYCLFLFVYLPYCCFCTYKLHDSKAQPYIIVRKPFLSYLITIINTLFIFERLLYESRLWCNLFSFSCSNHFQENLNIFKSGAQDNSIDTVVLTINCIHSTITIIWLTILYFPKIFYIYFELSRQNAAANQDWWKQINEQLIENIFIKYHSSIYFYSSTILMLYILMNIMLILLFGEYSEIAIYSFTCIVIATFCIAFYRKIPPYFNDDIFYLKKEIKKMISIQFPIYVIFIFCNSILLIISKKESKNTDLMEYVSAFHNIMIMFLTMILIYIVTLYPIMSFDNSFKNKTMRTLRLSIQNHSITKTIESKQSENPCNSDKDIVPRKWGDWTSLSIDNFNHFMRTLSTELSVENLLFITEITQFKLKILKKLAKLRKREQSNNTGSGRKTPHSMSRNNSNNVPPSPEQQNNANNVPSVVLALHSRFNNLELSKSFESKSKSKSKTRSRSTFATQTIFRSDLESSMQRAGIMTPFPQNTPKSAIVHSNASLQENILMFYDKYIDYPSAPFLINISGETRCSFNQNVEKVIACQNRYKENDLWFMLLIFDECIHETYFLLNSSWKRLRYKIKQELNTPIAQVMNEKLQTMQY